MHLDATITLGTLIQIITVVVLGIAILIRRDDTLNAHERAIIRQDGEMKSDREDRIKQAEIERATVQALAQQMQNLALSVEKLLAIVAEHQRRLDKAGS